MDKYGELVIAEKLISVHPHSVFATYNVQNNYMEKSSYMKPFGIVTFIAVEFYQVAYRTCYPKQSQPIFVLSEGSSAQGCGWNCSGTHGCLLLAGSMGWVLAAGSYLAAPMGSCHSPQYLLL